MVVTVLLLGLLAWSAPILPNRPALEDKTQSLLHLKRFHLKINELPIELLEAGLTAESIADKWRKRLTAAGFEMAEAGEDVPVLELRTLVITEATVPDALAINPYLMLHQRVTVERIGRALTVPTYNLVMVGLEQRKNIFEPTQGALDVILERFIAECRTADASVR